MQALLMKLKRRKNKANKSWQTLGIGKKRREIKKQQVNFTVIKCDWVKEAENK